MNRNEIIARLMENDSTVLSFPDRGPWGDPKYRGNCSGWYQAFLIWKYKVKKFAELFAGSGTGFDVAKDMKIGYVGADLNPTPVRPGILCVNAVTDEVPIQFTDADFLFMHPPYGAEIRIPYAGSMYPDPSGELSKCDLGQMPWETFMKTLNGIVMKYFAALQSGARMGILMGDVRRNGLHSMLTDIVKPGGLEQVLLIFSIFRSHSKRNWISGTADPQPGGMLFLQYSKSLEEHPPFQISTEKWKGMRRLFPIHTGRIKSDRYSRCIRILYPKAAVSGVLLHKFGRSFFILWRIHYSNFFLISII